MADWFRAHWREAVVGPLVMYGGVAAAWAVALNA